MQHEPHRKDSGKQRIRYRRGKAEAAPWRLLASRHRGPQENKHLKLFPRHIIKVVLDGVGGSAKNVPRVTPTQRLTVSQLHFCYAGLDSTPPSAGKIIEKSMKRHENYIRCGHVLFACNADQYSH